MSEQEPYTPTTEEALAAYEAWRKSGQEALRALLDIWHMVTPYDTKGMTFGLDPQEVVRAVAAAIREGRA